MVAASTQVHKIIQRYVRALKFEVHVERVILYGSYARNQAHEWSDIDIAVLSPDFATMSEDAQTQLLARRLAGCDWRIAPVAYTPAQFDNAKPYQFASEIKRTGKVVYDARRKRPRAEVRPKRRVTATRIR